MSAVQAKNTTSLAFNGKGREPYGLPERINGVESGDFASIWRARQRADALGVPYERFIIALMDDADANGTQELPRPNQLCSDAKVKMLIERFDEQRASKVFDPFSGEYDPRFYAANYVGDIQQQAALDWVQEQIDEVGVARKAALIKRYMRIE